MPVRKARPARVEASPGFRKRVGKLDTPYFNTIKPRLAPPATAKTKIVVRKELASLTRNSRVFRRFSHFSELSTMDRRLDCISCSRLVSSAALIPHHKFILLFRNWRKLPCRLLNSNVSRIRFRLQ